MATGNPPPSTSPLPPKPSGPKRNLSSPSRNRNPPQRRPCDEKQRITPQEAGEKNRHWVMS